LFDAYHVPKPLSQQLLQFGRSGVGLEVLTFGVELTWLFVACFSCSCSPLFLIRCDFEFWLGEVSDGPCVPGGQSAGAWRTICVLPADGPLFRVTTGATVCFFGQSAAQCWTVCGAGADSPRQQAGQSAWPVRTVRPPWPDGPPEPGCFVPWFDSSLPLSCFRVCFKESFLRLEVDP
jgi:hypothetical protein